MAEDTIIVIGSIEEAEDNKGKAYLKITDKAGVTRNFKEGRSKLLTNKGYLLEEGRAIKLHFADFTNPDGIVFPFVQDFEAVEGKLPPPQPSGQVLPEHQKVIDEAVKVKPAPQELGMWWKELGEMLRAKDIDITKPAGKGMRTAYYAQMMSVLDIKIKTNN